MLDQIYKRGQINAIAPCDHFRQIQISAEPKRANIDDYLSLFIFVHHYLKPLALFLICNYSLFAIWIFQTPFKRSGSLIIRESVISRRVEGLGDPSVGRGDTDIFFGTKQSLLRVSKSCRKFLLFSILEEWMSHLGMFQMPSEMKWALTCTRQIVVTKEKNG